MVAMIDSTSSTVLTSTSMAAVAQVDEFNNDHGFSFKEMLLLHATKSNLTTEELQCTYEITSLLSEQNTTTECSTGGSSSVVGGTSIIKAQIGSGQPSNEMPDITSEFNKLANGIIQVVNNVIIPERLSMSPSESPSDDDSIDGASSLSTTDSPTNSPTESTD